MNYSGIRNPSDPFLTMVDDMVHMEPVNNMRCKPQSKHPYTWKEFGNLPEAVIGKVMVLQTKSLVMNNHGLVLL